MSPPSPKNFEERVAQAAETVLQRAGSVGPLELFQELRWLQTTHFEHWRKGNPHYPELQTWIQVGPDKLQKALAFFHAWVRRRQLRPIRADYIRRGPQGIEELKVTPDGNSEGETFFRTHYVPADLPEKKRTKLAAKLSKPPELVVFQKVSDEGHCGECGDELRRGDFLLMEKGQPLCLRCADLDHLVFLPAGDTALTRRSRQHSPLAAVVVRFNRNRQRYERQGLLITEAALAKAEAACVEDASARAAARERAAVERQEEDREFIAAFAQAIQKRYPRCPAGESLQIAAHAGVRSSGRVGRSAAGRALDSSAVDLAVIAHIRHVHTEYDELLMQGSARLDARALVREKIDRVLEQWSEAATEVSPQAAAKLAASQ